MDEQPSNEAAAMSSKPNNPRRFLRYNNLRDAEKPCHRFVVDEREQGLRIHDVAHFVGLTEIVDLAYGVPVFTLEWSKVHRSLAV
jgi:hypothetical protein